MRQERDLIAVKLRMRGGHESSLRRLPLLSDLTTLQHAFLGKKILTSSLPGLSGQPIFSVKKLGRPHSP